MHKSYYLVLAVALGLLGGCNSADTGDHPPTHPVTVSVTYKGAPVAGATVAFIADGGTNSASGITDAAGKARLSTFGEGDGAVAGNYNVTVRKSKTTETPIPGSEEGDVTVEHSEELPAKYINAGESGLTALVAEGASNEISFDLTD